MKQKDHYQSIQRESVSICRKSLPVCLPIIIAAVLVATMLVMSAPVVTEEGQLNEEQLTQIAKGFFIAYRRAIRNDSNAPALMDLLAVNVELTYAGKPGQVLTFAGTFIGRRDVANALRFLRHTSFTGNFSISRGKLENSKM